MVSGHGVFSDVLDARYPDRAERVPLATTWNGGHVLIAGELGSRGRDALLRDPALHVSTPFRFMPCELVRGREMLSLFNVHWKCEPGSRGARPYRLQWRITSLLAGEPAGS